VVTARGTELATVAPSQTLSNQRSIVGIIDTEMGRKGQGGPPA